MFTSFDDYDGYAFYAANRLFMAIKNNLKNQGQIIKGKEVTPIKSCLNYTKTLLYPMKVDYLRDEKNLDSRAQKTAETFDEFVYRQQLRDEAWRQRCATDYLKSDVKSLIKDFDSVLEEVLLMSPFPKGSSDYKKLKISILFNVLNNLNHKRGIGTEPPVTIV